MPAMIQQPYAHISSPTFIPLEYYLSNLEEAIYDSIHLYHEGAEFL